MLRNVLLPAAALCAWLVALPAAADLPLEATGKVVTLPAPSAHWAWASDLIMRRATLVDLESGRMLGMVSAGWGPISPLLAAGRNEIYVAETHHSRGSRGERTDVLTIYDATTLGVVDEVVIPPKRVTGALPVHHSALSDDERFAMVFNLTPAASVSVVDLEERRLAGEIATPGCALVYPAGPRRIAMLCLDGALMLITLDDRGAEISRLRSAPFFDPEADPITEKGVRVGDRWLFASFEGFLYEVDFSGETPTFGEPWSLFSDRERAERWKIGGTQHLAVHEATGRLFSLVHQGGADTHKDPGSEIWVYDLASRERVQRIEIESPGITFMGVPVEAPESWIWPFGGLANALVGAIGEAVGIDEIRVTQDAEPLLVGVSSYFGGMAVFDARSGEFLRRVYSGNMTNIGISTPFGGGSAP